MPSLAVPDLRRTTSALAARGRFNALTALALHRVGDTALMFALAILTVPA
jgi:hypothetical protein